MSQFQVDLQKAKTAEQITIDTLRRYSYKEKDVKKIVGFVNVSGLEDCYYKGDIWAFNPSTGQEYYIDVKDDSRIAETHNILCEEENYWKETGDFRKGFMYYDYDYIAIVSQSEKKIYIIDFAVLKSIYRKGEFKEINHADNVCYCFLLPLTTAKKYNAILYTLDY